MNVKTIASAPSLSIDSNEPTKGSVAVKSESTSKDRDADGRHEKSGEGEKRHLSDEEFQKALAELEEIPGIRESSLSIHVEQKEGFRVVLVKDPEGRVVRRLSQSEMWSLVTHAKDRSTGLMLDKTG